MVQFAIKYELLKLILELIDLTRRSLLHVLNDFELSHYLFLQNSDLVLLWHRMQLNEIVF